MQDKHFLVFCIRHHQSDESEKASSCTHTRDVSLSAAVSSSTMIIISH